jgi:minor extracellular serine protease Vpr
MFRRLLTSVATGIFVVATVMTGSPVALADEDPTARFEAIDHGAITPSFVPYGLVANARVTVFVEMVGDPVAVVKGNAADNKISDAQRQAIKSDLRGKQDALQPQIESRGGKVLANFQVALNGLKVDIERGKLDQIAALPGVIAIREVDTFQLDNATSVPYIGTPAAWDGVSGVHGEGIKVGIIDTGVDYTHANFGGPGTVAAYDAAKAADTVPADPALFGPAAPKVKGGTDLVGDAYNAGSADPARRVPHPDPNPLDCAGHGSHVSGTAAGFGVRSDGTTYTGSYDATTYSTSFRIGPGVAPKADIYAIRVFGCSGSTRVVAEAIEWAVDHDMDVINMSLGSPFGSATSSSAVAAANAAKAGVTVVASAGNSGVSQYIAGSPASGDGVISVAANDSTPTFAGATLTLSTGISITALNANGATFSNGTMLPVKVLRNASGGVSLGCNPAEYLDVAGKIVVTLRGTCARVARAIYGQKAGAAAVAMINTDSGFPPVEGQITSNPDTGEAYTVIIPFLGVRGVLGPNPTADGDNLVAAAGGTATLANTALANPGFSSFASFSSAGPRRGDSVLKPDITAPGVSIRSTASGTGNQATVMSGTSMAAPHVSGVAALTRQAHPTWKNGDLTAAIVNTGNPAAIAGPTPYRTSRGGTGLVQPAASTKTQTVATGDKGFTSLRFGFKELGADYSETKTVALRNKGSSTATFNVAAANAAGSSHTIGLSAGSVAIPAGGSASVDVTLNVTAATAGNSASFREVAGLVTFTPATASDNNGVTLRMPYYLVPRALSNLKTKLDGTLNSTTNTSTTATTTNEDGTITGTADFYAWGLEDGKDTGVGPNDLRAIGVQSFANPSAADPDRRLLVFAISTWNRWSNATVSEYDIYIDVNNDGTDDFAVVGLDFGAVTTGSFDGRMAAFVFNLTTGAAVVDFFASAPTDSSTLLLPVRTSRLPGLSKTANPRFTYHAASFAIFGTGDDVMPGTAKYNAWTSSITQGQFSAVAPGASATNAVSIDTTEWAHSPAKGLLVVTADNSSGAKEADLVELSKK